MHEHANQKDLKALGWKSIVVSCDDPGDCITREASRHRADLIIMRSRRRPHRAALLGSVAESVCRTAPCPVLVMHADERDWINEGERKIGLHETPGSLRFFGSFRTGAQVGPVSRAGVSGGTSPAARPAAFHPGGTRDFLVPDGQGRRLSQSCASFAESGTGRGALVVPDKECDLRGPALSRNHSLRATKRNRSGLPRRARRGIWTDDVVRFKRRSRFAPGVVSGAGGAAAQTHQKISK